MEPVVIAAICTALGALVGSGATLAVGWYQSREARRGSRAAAALDQQWRNAHQASEWLVSEDEAVRRLGVAHLLEMEQFWATDPRVRAFVHTSLRSAHASVAAQAQRVSLVVQAPRNPSAEPRRSPWNRSEAERRIVAGRCAMSDRRLLVSDADIDIARLLVKLDRLDGRESDPATLRIAQAVAFDEADGDAEYDVADDVPTTSAFDAVEVGPGEAAGAPGSRYVLLRRPWVKVRPDPATPGVPAF